MSGICFCVCGCQSENSFAGFGAKPSQRASAGWDLTPGPRKWTREGTSQWRPTESVDKRDQKETISRREQKEPVDRTVQSGRWKQHREEGIAEVRKTTAKTCWPTEVRLANTRKWVSIPIGFVEVSRKYTPSIAYKYTESSTKVSKTSPLLRLELTQARLCSFILFFHPLRCVLWVRKKMCHAPGRR